MLNSIELNLDAVNLTDEQFYHLCQDNQDLRLEINAKGDLIIMPPTGGETGNRNARITQKLGIWTEEDGTGLFFDSSTLFKLPNGAKRSPDAAWIPLEKWQGLTEKQRQGFIPLAPDFVVELRSAGDRLQPLQDKMREYIDNGTRLGWLINRQDRQVEVYRQGRGVEVLDNPQTLSGEDVLCGFVALLDIRGKM